MVYDSLKGFSRPKRFTSNYKALVTTCKPFIISNVAIITCTVFLVVGGNDIKSIPLVLCWQHKAYPKYVFIFLHRIKKTYEYIFIHYEFWMISCILKQIKYCKTHLSCIISALLYERRGVSPVTLVSFENSALFNRRSIIPLVRINPRVRAGSACQSDFEQCTGAHHRQSQRRCNWQLPPTSSEI